MYAIPPLPDILAYENSNRPSRSRYLPPDSGGDSRRSPHRDRSPPRYNDGQDRGPFNSAPRENNYRPGSDNRIANNFPPRENYRETGRDLISNFQSREPPRGPKASLGDKPPLTDIPSGPRGNSFSHEAPSYRGNFSGPPRRGGAEYRNTSRDRAPPVRDAERDFRERRENRGPPSPERFNNNAQDRDFDDRNRFDRRESNYRGDSFRGRGRGRAISPRSRQRSPLRDDRGFPPPRPRGGGAWPRGGGGYRGRGGRGGFSDSRSDVGVGSRRRSRSPEREPFRPYNRRPDELDNKPPPIRPYSSVGLSQPRDNPSPPPQAPEVPAFGTVVNNIIPNGPHGQHTGSIPATPVPIPTGPRSERTQPFPREPLLREPFQRGTTIRTETELIWTANNHSAAPPNGPRTLAPSQSPVELFHNRRPQSMEPSYRPSYGYHRSPQPQSRPVSRESGAGARRVESPRARDEDQDVHMMEAGEVDETPRAQREPTPAPPVKVEDTITLVRRTTMVDMSFEDKRSDSDLEDDLGPEYFEKEIQAVKQEIKDATLKNAVEDEIFHYELIVANYTDELRAPIIPEPLPPVMSPKAEVAEKSPEMAVGKTDAPTPMVLDEIPPVPQPTAAQQTPPTDKEAAPKAPHQETPELATPSNELAELAISPKNKSPPKSKLSLASAADEPGDESAQEEFEMLETVRKRMATPPPASLPFRPISPPESHERFVEDVDNVDDTMKFLVEELRLKYEERDQQVEETSEAYKKFYKDWIMFHRSNNELAVKVRQRWEANRAAEVSRAASVAPEKDNKPEGRSRGRFATEHDMERILKLSEVEAREQRARFDRAAKAKLANEKEAVIPDMLSPEERKNEKYGDATNRVSPERALAVFQVLPPIPDFTDQERNLFEATMLEYPKQWGKIANQLPGRNYKHVIQYYYLVKHELKLKEKLKRGLKGRRKRKPKTSVHTVALGRDEDPEDPPPVIEEGGTRRRPKRAAAPTFGAGANAENAGPSESEGATPAPTSRRGAGTPKGEANGDTPTTGKRKGKQPKERATKQAKNTQLLAAATSNNAQAKNREETKVPAPIPMQEWKLPRQGPPEPEQLGYQQQLPVGGYDGAEIRPQRPATHTPPTSIVDRPPPPLAPYEAAPPGYRTSEGIVNTLPMGAYDQQNQRNMSASNSAPTSSYWSVSEADSFPALLKHFGTDWHGIAKWMASKTHIMVYTTVFQDWLTVPSDSNKSRRVANLAEQVKNYYQRQVDQGGKPEWEMIARLADEKKAKGESTGPPPMPSHNPVKRKYDGLPGDSPSRGPLGTTGMGPEELEEMWGNGPTQQQPPLKFGGMPGTGRFDSFTPLPSRAGTLGTFEIDTKRISSHSQHSIGHDPSPQPGASRFQPLAQAGQMPDNTRSAPPAPKLLPQQSQSQHLPQQMQQQQPGPQRGYFNVSTDRRPILHARSSHNSVASHGSPHPESSAHRSQAAKAMEEAHAEQQRAQRLIEEGEAERLRMGQQGQGRMPMKVEPAEGLPPHLSPHVGDLRDFEGQPPQHMQGVMQQQRMGQRHDGGSQPISPMRPEDRRPVQQQMPAYGRPFQGQPHPSQPQPQQIQSQRVGIESKMGITTGPSTPVIAAHAPIIQGHDGLMRGNTMSAPPQQQQQQPHVHAHHHHVHQHGMQQRQGHPSQGPPSQGQLLQGQPHGLAPHSQMQQQQQQSQQMKGQPTHPQQQAPPPPQRQEPALARKSNVFSLLNDDEPARMPNSQPKPSLSPVPFGGQGQGYAPASRMNVGGPPPGPREQQQQHMLRRETSHPDIRQAQQQPPQDLRPGAQRRETMPPQVRGHDPRDYPPENRVPNPQAQQLGPGPGPGPQQARSHAGSHGGSPLEGPRDIRELERDSRGMIRGEARDPRDPRDARDIGADPRMDPRASGRMDPRSVREVDDREREYYRYQQQEEQRRQQMIMQQQRQEQERQQAHQGHPASHGSQSAVNSPQIVSYQMQGQPPQVHPGKMGPGPQQQGPLPQSQGHRQGIFGREQLGHGSRHSSFDGRERQMPPNIVASQGPPPSSAYVTSHPEQRGFPPQQGPQPGPESGRFAGPQQAPPPPQSAPPRFEPGQSGLPPGPQAGRFEGPGVGGVGIVGGRADGHRILNAKVVANNQYAPVYATREQMDAQWARDARQAETRARGEPTDSRDARDARDGRFDSKDQRSLAAQNDPRDPRSISAHRDSRDPREIISQDPRDPRPIPPQRDPRDMPPQQREMAPRTYTPNPMMQPSQEVRGGPAFGVGAFGASPEEMMERERLLQREREAEREVNARLSREGGFGRR